MSGQAISEIHADLSLKMTQSKTTRLVAEPLAASTTTVQAKKLPTNKREGSTIRNPAVGLKENDARETENPFLTLIGSGNRKYSTDQIMRMTRGDDRNQL